GSRPRPVSGPCGSRRYGPGPPRAQTVGWSRISDGRAIPRPATPLSRICRSGAHALSEPDEGLRRRSRSPEPHSAVAEVPAPAVFGLAAGKGLSDAVQVAVNCRQRLSHALVDEMPMAPPEDDHVAPCCNDEVRSCHASGQNLVRLLPPSRLVVSSSFIEQRG